MSLVLTSTEALPELEQLLRRRTALGLDHRDEMWEGVLHMVPPAKDEHQALSGRLHRAMYDQVEANGLLLRFETGLFDPDDPANRWRVPDLLVAAPEHRTERGIEGPASLVVEILSPRDESFAKLPFYAEMGVREVLILEPRDLSFWSYRLVDGSYTTVEDGRLESIGAHIEHVPTDDGPALRFRWDDGTSADIRPWEPPAG